MNVCQGRSFAKAFWLAATAFEPVGPIDCALAMSETGIDNSKPTTSRRPTLVAAAGALVAMALVLGLSTLFANHGSTSATTALALAPAVIGKPAPEFVLKNLQPGQPPVKLSERGAKPAVVNFFASWCPPCRKELPLLASASRAEKGKVAFIGVDVNDSASPARVLVRDSGISYPVGVDPRASLANGTFDLLGLPDTAFVAANGKLIGLVKGPLTADLLDRWIKELISAPARTSR